MRERTRVDRLVNDSTNMEHAHNCSTHYHARAVCACWADLKTEPSLLERVRTSPARKMSAEEAFEQRVSFVFSTQDGMTKDQVREALRPNVGVEPRPKAREASFWTSAPTTG